MVRHTVFRLFHATTRFKFVVVVVVLSTTHFVDINSKRKNSFKPLAIKTKTDLSANVPSRCDGNVRRRCVVTATATAVVTATNVVTGSAVFHSQKGCSLHLTSYETHCLP